MPSSFLTLDDILRLPLRNFQTSVGPGLIVERGFRKHRVLDAYRLFASDTWRLGQRLTLNFGLAWSYEPNSFRADLTKPKLLTGLLGLASLNPPPAQKANFSPHFGFAWTTDSGKTVIRGGAARYFDPAVVDLSTIVNERHALSPAGTGRRTNIPGSSIIFEGRALEFNQRATSFTAADLLAILPGIRADLERQLDPDNRDFSFRNIDLNKTGLSLSDPSYQAAYALHFNLGVQRELAENLVLSTDYALRRFLHTPLFGIDYNRFNRPQGPVIPRCTAAQRNDLTAMCSAGPITFDNTSGIATYNGLLVRLEKRLSRGTQFLASYALASFKGTIGPRGPNQPASGFNNDNWFENHGPLQTDRRHVLNLSGFINLPWRFQASFAVSASSRPPFLAYVNLTDFNGDGTQEDLLPGSKVNRFGRGLGKGDLVALVERYNQQFANQRTLGGQTAPFLILPPNYSFSDGFFTQDLRVSRTFSFSSERVRLAVFGEVFNLFNIANLSGHSGNISNPAQFGQPS
ncbi:MAG: TonB-dependent receptor, partial [Acidobacteria bacterium]|nr:TonB-dependent receptor [Acidobacteriota bacterium]